MIMIPWFFLLFLVGMAVAMLAVLVLVLILVRRNNASLSGAVPPGTDEPRRVEQAQRVERISREIEKIDAMQAAGRISAAEAADLKAALEGQRRAWTESCAEFAQQSGAACANLARKRLAKSNNVVLAGVCGGLAEWIGCDATLLRVVYVLLALFLAGFPGILLYIVLWVILPPPEAGVVCDPSPATSAPAGQGGRRSWGCLIALLCLLLAVPLFLVVGMFGVRASAVRTHRTELLAAETHHQEQAMLRIPPSGVTAAHRLYAVKFRLAADVAADTRPLTEALARSGVYQNTPGENYVSAQSGSSSSGGEAQIYFWSSSSDNALREKLHGLTGLPQGCTFESLRMVGSAPRPSSPAAPAATEPPQ